MKITIDCNNDTLTINDSDNLKWKIKDPNQMLRILEEIFNDLPSLPVDYSISLETIDEDSRTTIGEW